jgi:hypothetical protein
VLANDLREPGRPWDRTACSQWNGSGAGLPEQHSTGKPAQSPKRGSKSIDGLGPASMVSEDALTGEGRSLSAIANVEFGVEVT